MNAQDEGKLTTPATVARHGTLVLVVGPSGVGKDTLIDGARAALTEAGGFHFPRREITRSASLGGEDFIGMTEDQFHRRRRQRAYSLYWCAHDNWYGVPSSIDEHIEAGTHVLVNVSRSIIPEARQRYRHLRVVLVTAPRSVLESRLRGRGRESDGAIAGRLARAEAFDVTGPDVTTFQNDPPVEHAVARFVDILRTLNTTPTPWSCAADSDRASSAACWTQAPRASDSRSASDGS